MKGHTKQKRNGTMPARGNVVAFRFGETACLILVTLAVYVCRPFLPQSTDGSVEDKPQGVYAKNTDDAWNRIFYYLFSRRVAIRYSDEFPAAAPFTELLSPFQPRERGNQQKSAGLFERFETGDRSIDPLYPSQLSSMGPQQVLSDPVYSELQRALLEAQSENTKRATIARALMQSDLWSAFDILYSHPAGEQLEARRRTLMDLLGRLIKKVALAAPEISTLPDNYTLSIGALELPDLFRRDSGWMEVVWFPNRQHDMIADFRRVSRVFIKPAKASENAQKFLDSLRNSTSENAVEALDGVGLVTQLLLIDSSGRITPTRITNNVQLRLFRKTRHGELKTTEIHQCELNRKLIVSRPGSGGFTQEDDSAPAYLPAALNDYGFASPQFTPAGADVPLLVRLRTRCAFCHGGDLTGVITFAMRTELKNPYPAVTQFDPASNAAADYVALRKSRREDWKTLRQYFIDGSRK
jgi:hypothetical protein